MTPTYKPLPSYLKVGDKIGCPAHYDNPEILEVIKVCDTGHLLLRRANGNAVTQQWTRDQLSDYDYVKFVTDGTPSHD